MSGWVEDDKVLFCDGNLFEGNGDPSIRFASKTLRTSGRESEDCG